MPFKSPSLGSPTLGEEPGEDPDLNPVLEDGYSTLTDGLIVDLQQTVQDFLDDPSVLAP